MNHPQRVVAYREKDVNGYVNFQMVLTTEEMLNGFGCFAQQVVGLDAVWKYTKYKIPIWAVVFATSESSYVGSYFISSDGTAESIGWCLSKLLSKLPSTFKPFVMIDHDDAERLAIQMNNVSSRTNYILYRLILVACLLTM